MCMLNLSLADCGVGTATTDWVLGYRELNFYAEISDELNDFMFDIWYRNYIK